MNIQRPGNYGWPYCATPDQPYVDYDFATGDGEPFNCLAPVNESRHNTGRRILPPVVQPDIWYSYQASPLFPELGAGGVGPMGGPAYDFDAGNPSPLKWPKHYDGKPLFYEWTRDYIKALTLGGGGRLADIEPVVSTIVTDNPIDLEFGPDGALYLLEYGDGFYQENPEAQLTRIDFVRGDYTPVPKVASNVSVGLAPLTVNFSSAGTADPDGDRLAYAWDFNADGVVDSAALNPTYTFTRNGVFDATLKVTDRTGRTAAASVPIIVGNTAPVAKLTTSPAPGEPFTFGQNVTYTVAMTDNSPVECAKVTVAYILGHENHGHPLSSTAGCTGTLATIVDSGHAGASNLRAVFVASYTDQPEDPEVPPLSASDEIVLTPTPAPRLVRSHAHPGS
jgi:PKD repeat protein